MAAEMGLKCREPMSLPSDTDETQELVTDSHRSGPSRTLIRRRLCLLLVALLASAALVVHSLLRELADGRKLHLVTWNIAAINNNPFEYWITHDDADYNALMEGVQSFIDQPGERDVPVSQVFTPAP